MNVHGTFAITGEEGSGKSLITISKIYEYMLNGRKVISNFDLYLDNLLPWWSKATYLRVPDFPDALDLWDCGEATLSANESEFGLVAMDEIAVAANAREWNQNGRKELIDYFRQTRKHGFDKFFLSQGLDSIDAQIRKDLIKFHVVCRRTDSIKIPFIGSILRMVGFTGMLPNMHVATVKNGIKNTRETMVADRWYTQGKRWYDCYNTKQKFTNDPHIVVPPRAQDMYTDTPLGRIKIENVVHEKHQHVSAGTYSVLSAWHLKGRYMTPLQKVSPKISKVMLAILAVGFLLHLPSYYTGYQKIVKPEKYQEIDFKHAESDIKGVLRNFDYYTVLLNDGSYKTTKTIIERDGKTYYEIDNELHKLSDKDTASTSSLTDIL